MVSRGHALSRDALIRTLTAYSGITSEDGAGDGTTLVDTNLIDNPSISPSGIPEKTVLIMSGDARGEDKGSASFNNATGAITLQGAGFSAQIKAGTIFRILNISSIEIDVANIDTKIGTNTDPAGTTTLFAWLLKIFTLGGQGGFYYGKVTQVDDNTNFRVSGLAGIFDDAYFANTYRVYVVRDAAGLGAAPQGEMQPCSGFSGTDAIFTHTVFTADLAVDDEVLLLHERIAEIADLVALIGTAADNGDLSTLFAKLKQQYLGIHAHVLLVVADASALDADMDTALKNELEDRGYVVQVADPTDIAGNLELAFDFIVVSGSITVDTNLGNLRDAESPVICHSAAVAVSANVFSLGATAGTEAAQTDIEIITNTIIWLIATATGDLTVTASATINHMQTKAANALKIAETSIGSGNTFHTMVRLTQGVADDSGYIANFDRYFIGVKDFTAANAVFKALMATLWEHVLHEVRFSEVTVTPKRVYQEQIPDTAISISPDDTLTNPPPNADAANSVVDIDKKTNRTFVLRSLFINISALGGGTATMTFKLWVDIGGTPTEVDSVDVTSTGYQNLMDLFGLPEVHADSIHITATVNAATGTIAGIYRYAEAKK